MRSKYVTYLCNCCTRCGTHLSQKKGRLLSWLFRCVGTLIVLPCAVLFDLYHSSSLPLYIDCTHGQEECADDVLAVLERSNHVYQIRLGHFSSLDFEKFGQRWRCHSRS